MIGFSGTKDNNLLLPLQVEESPPDPVLKGTDGKMLKLILQQQKVSIVKAESRTPLSTAVLRLAVKQTSALIDAGATMAGLSNSEVAAEVLSLLLKTKTQGVVFFDTAREPKTWVVRNRNGHEEPLKSSPIHERDAFVYFDESRCRGADTVCACFSL